MAQGQERSKHPRSPARDTNQTRVRFAIDSKRRAVIAKFGGRLTVADIQRYVQDLRTHPSFDPSFSEIADISEVKDLPLEVFDFMQLADHTDPFSAESKRAFVAQTSVQEHAARMHKILRNQRKFRIFRTLEEAESWISSETAAKAG